MELGASGFGVENLPYGVVRLAGGERRPAVRLGEHALDLRALAPALGVPAGTFDGPLLNPFLELGAPAWQRVRERLADLVAEGSVDGAALLPLGEVQPVLPVAVGDYVDFYSSLEHASRVGRIFRPDAEPLAPNWRRLPVGYHGRAGTIVVSGTPVRRPCGQRPPVEPDGEPSYGPERRLDFELELGFVTGPGPAPGEPIAAASAAEHIFGFVLVNDWSARELQRWEYRPLGPFLGKSFATSVSPWIVPLAALEPLRVPGPVQEPEPLPYLTVEEPWALDLDLEAALVPAGASEEVVVSRVNARGLYWSPAQQLAHATVNGASVRAGDLFASGTISGPEPRSAGCLLELTWDGRDPLPLPGGGERTFLEDGDTVVLRGGNAGARVSLGEVRGTVVAPGPTTHP